MDQIIERWSRAALRAEEEKVRIISVGGTYRATSSSSPFGSYVLAPTPEGWACECVSNGQYGMPCKHLWALASLLDLDILQDVKINWDLDTRPDRAA